MLLRAIFVVSLVVGAMVRVLPSGQASPCGLPALPARAVFGDQDARGQVRLDRTKPVPAKADVIAAWRKRQDAVTSFRFAWVEQQCRVTGWIANPRYPQRDWLAIPALLIDRSYSVSKTLAIEGPRMRYQFELDRAEESDGVRVKSPTGDERGLGVHRHYVYLSVFDGQRGEVTTSTLLDSPPPASIRTSSNIDAQALDLRPIMLAFRPLDATLGHLLIDRAVTNQQRTFYHDKSTFLLEEQHDPSGWKTVLVIEPERDYLISRVVVEFEQKAVVDMDVDYQLDTKTGWVPSGWRVLQMAADGRRRVTTIATVSSYDVNGPIAPAYFTIER